MPRRRDEVHATETEMKRDRTRTSGFSEAQGPRTLEPPDDTCIYSAAILWSLTGDRCRTFGSTSFANNSNERFHACGCST